jgi:hypothetical protein
MTMRLKVFLIVAVMTGSATLGAQGCFYPSYGPDQSQYGSSHTVCDTNGNNCLVCDADNSNCHRVDSQSGSNHTVCDDHGNNCMVCEADNRNCRPIDSHSRSGGSWGFWW